MSTKKEKTNSRDRYLKLLMGDVNEPRCGAARTHSVPTMYRPVQIVNGSMFCELAKGHEYYLHAARTKSGSWFEWIPPYTEI